MEIAKPLVRPTYTHTLGLTEEQWVRENMDDLEEWYAMTGDTLPQDDPQDFRDFCAVQYELTQDNDAQLKQAFAEWAKDDDAYEDLMGREIDAELDGDA